MRSPELLTGVVAVVSVMLVAVFEWGYVSGDPLAYHERMADILDAGRIPYIQADYEHLPAMLVPMSAVWYAGGFLGALQYRAIWAVCAALALVLTASGMRLLGNEIGDRALAVRWLMIAAPLIPIVLFRTEPWIVLPVILSLLAMVRSQWTAAAAWTFVGILGKAWPGVIAIGGWLRGNSRRVLLATIGGGVFLIVVAISDGFRRGRTFTGMHAESAGGAGAALWMTLSDGSVHLAEVAGAVYVEAAWAWGLVGVLLAAPTALLLVRRLRPPLSPPHVLLAMGGIVGVGLLILPLQSTQFLFWITPFVAVTHSRLTRGLVFLVGFIGLVNLVQFESMVLSPEWWFPIVAGRNCLLAWSTFRLAREALSTDALGLDSLHAASWITR